jgi:hypothetical protein
VTECALCLLSAVTHRCEADAAEFRDGAEHVEHDAGLTCLVEMETMAYGDVEEVVDREAAQQVRLEVSIWRSQEHSRTERASFSLGSCIRVVDTLVAVAELLRGLHDATLDFVPPAEARWMLTMPGDLPVVVVCHNDFAPYNVVFANGRPVGAIDWETAAPGARVWDVAYAAYRFVPLSRGAPAELAGEAVRARRLALFCEAYGLGASDREILLATAARRVAALRDLIVSEAASGNPVFSAHLADGHVQEYEADLTYLRASAAALAGCL